MSSSDVAGAGSSASNPQESVSDLGLVRLGPANGFTGGPPAAAETDMSTALLPARRCGLNASPRLYLLVGVSSIGGFLFGYDTGVVSGALLLIRATSYEGGLGGDSPLDHFEQETIVSSTIACCIVSSLCSGRASQQCGRKPVLITACLIFTAGALLMAAAPSLLVLVPQRMAVRVTGPQPTPQPKPWPQPQPSPLLEPNPYPKPQLGALSLPATPTMPATPTCQVAGRMIVGIAVGLASSVVPVYIAELAPPRQRGRLVAFNNLCVVVGQVAPRTP